MSLLLLSTIKVSVVLAAALGALACLRQRSAAVRHATLLAAVVLAAAIPVLQLAMPAWSLQVIAAAPPSTSTLEFLAIGPGARTATPLARDRDAHWAERATAAVARTVVPVWLGGAVAGLGLLLHALRRLRRLERDATHMADGDWPREAAAIAREYGLHPPHLLRTTHPSLLVTWGWRRTRVLLPVDADAWSGTRVRLVLRHELAHVRRRDWIAHMLGELLRIAYWFNPLVWIACRRLRQESEQACDDRVLRSGIEPSVYATELLEIARAFGRHGGQWAPVPAAARPSTLHRRIRAMLMPDVDRRPAAGLPAAVAALALLILTLTAAGFGVDASAAPALDAPDARAVAGPSAPADSDSRVTVNDATAAGTGPNPGAGSGAGAAPPPAIEAAQNPVADADSAAATFSGVVVDASGGALPGVRVSLSRARDGEREERWTTTTPSGSFRLTEVPPGGHDLQLTLPGFAPVARRVSFEPGADAHLELMMRLGTLQETITVGRNELEPGTVSAAQNRAAQAIREAAARAQNEPITAPEGLIPPRVPGAPVRVGGNIQAPRKTKDVRPLHPTLGLSAYGGVVALQARIGEHGRVESVLPLWATNAQLADAASVAVAQWEFTPTRLNGRQVPVNMFVTVNFTGQ